MPTALTAKSVVRGVGYGVGIKNVGFSRDSTIIRPRA